MSRPVPLSDAEKLAAYRRVTDPELLDLATDLLRWVPDTIREDCLRHYRWLRDEAAKAERKAGHSA